MPNRITSNKSYVKANSDGTVTIKAPGGIYDERGTLISVGGTPAAGVIHFLGPPVVDQTFEPIEGEVYTFVIDASTAYEVEWSADLKKALENAKTKLEQNDLFASAELIKV